MNPSVRPEERIGWTALGTMYVMILLNQFVGSRDNGYNPLMEGPKGLGIPELSLKRLGPTQGIHQEEHVGVTVSLQHLTCWHSQPLRALSRPCRISGSGVHTPLSVNPHCMDTLLEICSCRDGNNSTVPTGPFLVIQ